MQELIYQKLKRISDFPTKFESYSPLFSSIGLCVNEKKAGIGEMFFNHNNSSRALFDKFVEFPYRLDKEKSYSYLLIFGDFKGAVAFWRSDCFLLECKDVKEIPLFTKVSKNTVDLWCDKCDSKELILCGYTKNGDKTDPDEKSYFNIGVRAINGKLSAKNGYKAVADKEGKVMLAFCFQSTKSSPHVVSEILSTAPTDLGRATILACRWLINNSQEYTYETQDEKKAEHIATAIKTLLYNATNAGGNLEGYTSAYPQRGAYPASYLWDTTFSYLGYSHISSKVSKDILSQVANAQRNNGKIPRYLCTTFEAPKDVAPAIYGKAIYSLAINDYNLAWETVPALEDNNLWWLTNRMTRYGLICDNRNNLSVSMNAFVINQLRICEELSRFLEVKEKANLWYQEADVLEENLMKHLYCEEDGMFYDKDAVTGEFIKTVGMVNFLPLLLDMPFSEKKAKAMIKKYLLNKEYMFGEFPFPAIAYNREDYKGNHLEKGAIKLDGAIMMLIILEKFGYTKERKKAIKKLIELIEADGTMREAFDSQTGKGVGNVQFSPTAAIYLKLIEMK